MSLEEAVRRLTFESASTFGLYDRGLLRPGMVADIVIFDPDTVRPLPLEVVHDFPTGARRIKEPAQWHHGHDRQRRGLAGRRQAQRCVAGARPPQHLLHRVSGPSVPAPAPHPLPPEVDRGRHPLSLGSRERDGGVSIGGR